MADVKVKLEIDDSGALETLRRFNETFKDINAQSKGLTKNLNNGFKKVNSTAQDTRRTFNRVGSQIRRTKRETTRATGAFDKMSLSIASIKNVASGVFISDILRNGINLVRRAVVDSVVAFADFEEGLTRVAKTANLTDEEIQKFGQDLQDLDIATSNENLLELSAVAGQLGIKGSDNILKFTDTLAKLETATDVVGQEGASSIARILNVTGTAVDQVDQFGAALVDLGNNSAATEREILGVATRVAQQTVAYKLTSAEVLAFGAALKSLGVPAERGGSSVGRAFTAIDLAIAKGGDTLSKFTELLGVSAEELETSFREDRVGVVLKFLEKLGENSEGAIRTLNDLGLADVRVSGTLATLAGNIDDVNSKFDRSRTAFDENTALTDEYERTLDDLNTLWVIFKRNVEILAIQFVQVLAPALKLTLQGLNAIIDILKIRPFDIEPEVDLTDVDVLLEKIREASGEAKKVKIDPNTEELQKSTTLYAQLQRDIAKVEANKTILLSEQKAAIAALNLEYSKNVQLSKEQDAAFNKAIKIAGGNESVNRLENIQKNERKRTDALKAAEAERLLVFQTFQQSRDFLEAEFSQARADAFILAGDERLTLIQEQLGQEEALRLLVKVRELEEEGKQKDALLAINKSFIKAKSEQEKQRKEDEAKANREILQGRQSFFAAGATLARSASKEARAVGKAAALLQIGLDTEVAVSGAYKFGNSLGGPALGTVFGAIAAAAQAQRAANVLKFQDGGVVPGSSFNGDQVPARVNSGEMILNRQQQTQLFNVANGGGGGNGSTTTNITVELDGEVVTRAVSKQVANGFELGEQV